jgi:BirA family biotin operon repressor/biotin-[acetyl-CoA-carboxylase] ligase
MRPVKLGEPLIHLVTVDSTNNYAALRLRNGTATEGTVILADYQWQGKGQGGNQWISEQASNLLFSIILCPDFIPADRQFYLSMCISNGLVDILLSLGASCKVKWPNDILLDNKKVAGILIENTIMGEMLNTSVIGIGLNVNQRTFSELLPNPTSLFLSTGKEYNLAELFPAMLSKLELHIYQLYDGRLDVIRTNYLNHLYGLNEWLSFTDAEGSFEGRITDVTDTGELIVKRRNSEIKYYGYKEVSLL